MEEANTSKAFENTVGTGYSPESIDIDEEQLDLFVDNVIHTAASSLHGLVLRVTSPEGTDRYFSSEITQSGNASESRSTPENDSSSLESQQPDSPRKHFLEKAGQPSQITDSNDIKILQGNHLASRSKDVATKALSPGSTEKVILDCTKSEQGYTTEEDTSKCTADDSFTLDSQEKDSPTGHTLESSVKLAQVPIEDLSSDSSLDSSKDDQECPSSPKAGNKKKRFGRFKQQRKSSAVAPVTDDKLKEMQPPKVAFEDQPHLTSDMNVSTFITKSEHCDEVGDNIFLLNTKDVPLVSFFPGSKSKALANNLCINIEKYIKDNLAIDKFTIIIHGGKDGSKLGSIRLAKKFYHLLKARFSKDLKSCIILRAKLTLKCVLKLSKLFMPNEMKQKISLVNDICELVWFHSIPDTVLQYWH
ncbi:unnamed protein product [Pocillopora meandrina]|uniref:CRAL-TRIO domain-containing protein n=1 Tax=Pocillopora meandrina TaxID=46732 RepID=A0AAU9WY01_9CNID|nr:unnamed protein product [Pocillopora meandrina]